MHPKEIVITNPDNKLWSSMLDAVKSLSSDLDTDDSDKPADCTEPDYPLNLEAYYVTCHDTFMSNWGHASGKKNILSFRCESLAIARVVAKNATNRSDMRKVEINKATPSRYYSSRYLLQHKDDTDYSSWYVDGYFKN